MRSLLAIVVGVAIASSVVAAQGLDPKKVDAGKTIFDTQKCATCHNIKGVGGKLSTDLFNVSAKHPEAEIRQWLTTPATLEAKLPKKPLMPMSTYLKTHKLADADVDALTAYLLSLK